MNILCSVIRFTCAFNHVVRKCSPAVGYIVCSFYMCYVSNKALMKYLNFNVLKVGSDSFVIMKLELWHKIYPLLSFFS